MDLRIVNPLDIEGWDELVSALPESSFFHSSAWVRVLSETYRYKPTYFALFENDKLLGLLPVMDVKSSLTGHRGVSLPFSDFCQPLLCDGIRFCDLFESVVSYGKKRGWRYIELRGGQQLLSNAVPSQTFLIHTLSLLPDEDKVMAKFRDSTRRNIKKAAAEGVTAKIFYTTDAVKEFYRLNCLTRRAHGLPPQPYLFFEAIHRHIISKGYGFVILAQLRNKPMVGNMYFHFGNKGIYKYGASDRQYQKFRANNLAMWEAIRWFCRNGHKELHFGRTDPDHQGLRQFKMGWGVDERPISYYRYEIDCEAFVRVGTGGMSKMGKKMLSLAPLPVLRTIGTLLYRHLG